VSTRLDGAGIADPGQHIRQEVIHAPVQFCNSHLWAFRVGGTGSGQLDPDGAFGDGPHDMAKATLLGMLSDVGGVTIKWLYDFGDDWEPTVKIETIFPDVNGLAQPFQLEATGRGPPEEIGGPWGYAAFIEGIADQKHERHAEFDDAGLDQSAQCRAIWARRGQSRDAVSARVPELSLVSATPCSPSSVGSDGPCGKPAKTSERIVLKPSWPSLAGFFELP
jgi:hypothetical protein